jgi:putative FmdB family regulatory protein
MPTYEYACTNADCGSRFDLVQSFSDPAASECPTCGHGVRKVYGAVGVVFKGSGFYRNDSRDSNKAASASKSESAAASTPSDSGSGSGSSDSAPKKTESAPKADKPAVKSTPTPASTPA